MSRLCLLLCFAVLCCSCSGPSVKYDSIRTSDVRLPPNAIIDLYEPGTNVDRRYDVLGRLNIDDTGISVNCGWDDVIKHAEQKARDAGAQAVRLTEIRKPDIWSTCYRIRAELIKYTDIPAATPIAPPVTHVKVPQDEIPPEKVQHEVPRSEVTRNEQPVEDPVSTSNRWAVVIGIGSYGDPDWPAIPFADDDAARMKQWLLKEGWSSSHIKSLVNAQATERNVKIALESWLSKARTEDVIVLYWAGHGFPDPEDPEKVYFACYDTDPNIPATGFRMDQVVRILKERNAKNVIVLADTCHAGKLITRGERGLSVLPSVKRMQEQESLPKGWVFMVSADTDRKAVEHSSWRNGAFTHCLLNGLEGKADGFQSVGVKDGTVTLGELRAYLTTAMPDETQKVLGVAKHPLITTSSGDPSIWNLTLQAE